MNDDELKQLWQQQPLREPDVSPAQLIAAMQNKTTRLRGCLDARDLREVAMCGVLIVVFGMFFFTVYVTPVSRVGDLIIIGSLIFIGWKLVHTRRSTPPAPPGATIVESLRAELKAVRAQSHLLGSILWWYVLPPTVGEIIATWGLAVDLAAKMTGALFFAAVGALLWWVNQWARCKQLLPLEAQLESMLRSAETGEPLDEAQIAGLRPIAISLAAAGRVKPVEFKVAFWQIAFFGEIGCVGIWFFYALEKTKGDVLQMFAPEWLVWAGVWFLVGLVYSWLLQKLTVRAVGISSLGIHLQKGVNLLLWDEIKEVRTLRVLYIRSLWLIKESGEKTVMPWTSLERHAELRAAVEECAPEGHPLRRFLELL